MSTLHGLTTIEAKKLLSSFGYNEIKDVKTFALLSILIRQIKGNFVVYLLLGALLISFFVGKTLTAYVIGGVIVVVIISGFVQEYKAEKAIKALKGMLMQSSIVIRDGKQKEILSRELVVGDIVILRTGEKVPADCLVIKEKELRVNESILTGESREVKKLGTRKETISDEHMVFMGTLIVSGKCICKVLHTGMNTKFGKVANLISTTEKELPLQKKIDTLAKRLVFLGVLFSLITGALMFFNAEIVSHELITDILIIIIAISVASFPEGFPVVLTTALSLGAYRMAQKNAIVNRMSIIETLGETTVICSDKTGTLTKGEMTVKSIFVVDKRISVSGIGYEQNGSLTINDAKINVKDYPDIHLLLKSAVLCNDAKIERTGEDMQFITLGSPTEAALLVMSAKASMYVEDIEHVREDEVPFTSERKIMSVLCKEGVDSNVYAKGAPEILLTHCSHIQKGSKVVVFSKKEKEEFLLKIKSQAQKAYRTIGFAYKKNCTVDDLESPTLIFLGFVAMEDPPRPEVSEALKACYSAGIKVKMITGDNKETALSIAKQIGLKKGQLLEGKDIDALTDAELVAIVKDVVIFARVKPEHKLRIVRALKENKEIVTMTGDGVNDAPALKEAHIGVAMGKNGTDVSRSVADLVLKDDNFASIVDAIKEGRTIFKNIQKFASYQLSINFSQVGLIFFSTLIGLPLPLIAIQILFMNLFSDEIIAITLAFNPHSQNVMKIPPRKKSSIVTDKLVWLIVVAGLYMSSISTIVFFVSQKYFNYSLEEARTLVFIIMVLFSVANAFNFRSFRKYTLTRTPFTNMNLVYGTIISFVVSIGIIYTPIGEAIFEVVPLSFTTILIAILISFSIILLFDIIKAINSHKNLFTSIE